MNGIGPDIVVNNKISGLLNLGNTCYLNSSLIALLSCKPISRTLLCGAVRTGVTVTAAGKERMLQAANGVLKLEHVLDAVPTSLSSSSPTDPATTIQIAYNSKVLHEGITKAVFPLQGTRAHLLQQSFTIQTPKIYNLLYLLSLHFLSSTTVPEMLLIQIKSVIAKIDKGFNNNNQQDAHEFLKLVLGTLATELEPIGSVLTSMPLLRNRRPGTHSSSDKVNLSVDSILGRELKRGMKTYPNLSDSLFKQDGVGVNVSTTLPDGDDVDKDLFRKRLSNWSLQSGLLSARTIYFEMRVHRKCCGCDFKRSSIEIFEDIPLDFLESQAEKGVDLQTLLSDFFKKTKKITFKCEQSGCSSNESYVMSRLSTVPHVLIIHLKRFVNDGLTGRISKRNDPVDFPIHLTLDSQWYDDNNSSTVSSTPPPSFSSSSSSTPSSSSSSSASSSVVCLTSIDILKNADDLLAKLKKEAKDIVDREGICLVTQLEYHKEAIAKKRQMEYNKEQSLLNSFAPKVPSSSRAEKNGRPMFVFQLNKPVRMNTRALFNQPESKDRLFKRRLSLPTLETNDPDWKRGRYSDYKRIVPRRPSVVQRPWMMSQQTEIQPQSPLQLDTPTSDTEGTERESPSPSPTTTTKATPGPGGSRPGQERGQATRNCPQCTFINESGFLNCIICLSSLSTHVISNKAAINAGFTEIELRNSSQSTFTAAYNLGQKVTINSGTEAITVDDDDNGSSPAPPLPKAAATKATAPVGKQFKNEMDVAVGKRKNIKNGSTKSHSWKLRSVVNHIGDLATSGHYVTNARGNLNETSHEINGEGSDEQWREYNDEKVTDIKTSVVISKTSQERAYILFYERIEDDDNDNDDDGNE